MKVFDMIRLLDNKIETRYPKLHNIVHHWIVVLAIVDLIAVVVYFALKNYTKL